MMNWRSGTKVVLLLAIVALCLFEYSLHQSTVFREFEAAFLSLQWMLLICLAAWCGTLLFLTFALNDLPLIGLLLIALLAYFVGYAASPIKDALTLLTGVTLGKAARVLLSGSSRPIFSDTRASGRHLAPTKRSEIDQSGFTSAVTFFTGMIGMLAFASWWHLDLSNNFYHGPRWMGLWYNPNDYGLLMGAGTILTVGLLAGVANAECGAWSFVGARALTILLFLAAGMMGVGLLFSYSRGAWLGTAVGLSYLARAYGKFKWRFVLPGILIVAAVTWSFWNATSNMSPWFVKRLDISRPSAQHRVAAWKAGFEMMQDHPFGVGWNKAVETYEKYYSPPKDSAAAIKTNDYLMLGTQLGLPGLLCFVAYIALCFKKNLSHLTLTFSIPTKISQNGEEKATSLAICHSLLRAACRAGTLAMLVTFWFDGGLFTLPTAAVFWILLELSQKRKAEFT
jgi:O-antigen ligase